MIKAETNNKNGGKLKGNQKAVYGILQFITGYMTKFNLLHLIFRDLSSLSRRGCRIPQREGGSDLL